MTDFLITEMTLYPWFTWLLVVFAAVGVGYGCTWVAGLIMFVSDWMTHKREAWRDDPPEYQHPDEDEDEPLTEPDEDKVEAFLDALHDMGIVDRMEDEPPREWSAPVRCDDHTCKYCGWVHPPPCRVAPPVTSYRDGPAMPPQPWEGLHPAIMDDLEAAGFSEHETTDGALDSMFTRAEARVVEAMLRDGEAFPTDETGRSHRASSGRKDDEK